MFDERVITRAIVETYLEEFRTIVDLDVAVVGSGPSGLVAARELAKRGYRVAVFEKRLSVGGGLWGGGMLMNRIVVQESARPVLEEFGVRTREYAPGVYVAHSVETVAALVYGALQAGAYVFNGVAMEDVVVRDGRVAGLVLNWGAVHAAGLHVDPLAIHSRAVLDATGHEAEVVRKLAAKNGVSLTVSGERSMWADRGEEETVALTGEVYPGLFASGMAATNVYGGHRMGPIFGGMLLSGVRAAELIAEALGS
ncbi:sulfide-dependent adenosine diphosphate thiazole synthase [Brockia lithotrophica]|uniref:Thiamine thiazole synthase n=1 Tax=Brockia lithotrophica TaxID=933949 RepID=A0A660L135_9BACL|nr:sulfide-dependent adenosine diphosphate thiazole synthase [Brockia lithotrophica]RKQ84269.1 thiazole-adenylate synthase [Brockia lithotrophica]